MKVAESAAGLLIYKDSLKKAQVTPLHKKNDPLS
jgi:hypothetical protein